jgi:hypothetical protein
LHVTNETAKHALTRAHAFSFGGQEVCEHRFLKNLVFMHVSDDVPNVFPKRVFPKHHNLIQYGLPKVLPLLTYIGGPKGTAKGRNFYFGGFQLFKFLKIKHEEKGKTDLGGSLHLN